MLIVRVLRRMPARQKDSGVTALTSPALVSWCVLLLFYLDSRYSIDQKPRNRELNTSAPHGVLGQHGKGFVQEAPIEELPPLTAPPVPAPTRLEPDAEERKEETVVVQGSLFD